MDKQASLLGVQNNKLSTVQDSDMSAENLEHSCSVVVKDLVTSSTPDTCGVRSIDVTHSGLIEEIARRYGLSGHFGISAGGRIWA